MCLLSDSQRHPPGSKLSSPFDLRMTCMELDGAKSDKNLVCSYPQQQHTESAFQAGCTASFTPLVLIFLVQFDQMSSLRLVVSLQTQTKH